jgi:hypothetical protein
MSIIFISTTTGPGAFLLPSHRAGFAAVCIASLSQEGEDPSQEVKMFGKSPAKDLY